MNRFYISKLSTLLFSSLLLLSCNDEKLPESLNSDTNKIGLQLSTGKVSQYAVNILCSVANVNETMVASYGICWDTNEHPSITNGKRIEYSNLNEETFSTEIKNLSPYTVYYFKAYIIVEGVVIYSNQLQCKTLQENIYAELYEDFSTIENHKNIDLVDWLNFSETGKTVWTGEVGYDDNKYAKMTSFLSQDNNCISWLLTPLVDFNENTCKRLFFKSAQDYWTHEGLSVWVILDLNGTNMENSTKVELLVDIAGEADHGYPIKKWIDGEADLSSFKGIGRVGFRYEGNKRNQETGQFYIDDVKILNNQKI